MPEGTFAKQSESTATQMEAAVPKREVAEEREVSLKEFKFFMPSSDLANAIMEENQHLVSEYVERNYPPGYLESETESQTEEGGRETRMAKRLISERLFHYLSSLAETPRAVDGNDFPLWDYLSDGMATMLGLSAYRDMPSESPRAKGIRRLVDRITFEFREWLRDEQRGAFVTPWIEIHLADDALRFVAIEDEIEILPEANSVAEVQVGQIYRGTVRRIVDFGAYVEIYPGTDGLLHVTEISNHRVYNARDELKEGQQIYVMVIRKDGDKIVVSRKALMTDLVVSAQDEATSNDENSRISVAAKNEVNSSS
jgi:predicted RNA-binding protein with RPS1 domain